MGLFTGLMERTADAVRDPVRGMGEGEICTCQFFPEFVYGGTQK